MDYLFIYSAIMLWESFIRKHNPINKGTFPYN